MKRLVALFAIWLGALFFIRAGCCGNPPTTPIKPIGNAQTSVGFNEAYKTMSTDPSGKTIKYVFDWGDGSPIKDSTDFTASGETTGLSHVWGSAGTFNVKAFAITDDNRTSAGWSDPLAVTVGANTKPGIPDAPQSEPASGAPNVAIAFWSKATDPQSDSIQIQFLYDCDSNPTSSQYIGPWRGPVPSGGQVYDTFKYTKARDVPYNVRCVARQYKGGVAGLLSDTSSSYYFQVSKVSIGWRYPKLGAEEAGGVFKFSPALIDQGSGQLEIIASCDYESTFAFTDKGTASPTVNWVCVDPAETPSPSDAPSLSFDHSHVYFPADNFKLYYLSSSNLATVATWPDPFDSVLQEFSTPAVTNGRLYTGRGESLVCLLDNGGLTYHTSYNALSGIASAAAINQSGDHIYFGDDTGDFICVNAECQEVWKCGTGGQVSGGAAAIDANGNVWVGRQEDGRLYGYAAGAASGDTMPIFTSAQNLASDIVGNPVIGPDGKVYVVRDDGSVEAYAGGSAGLNQPALWTTTQTNTGCDAAPCLAPDSTIIIHTSDDALIALRLADGSQKWTIQLPTTKKKSPRLGVGDVTSSPTIGPNSKRIYVGSDNNGFFYAVNVDFDAYGTGTFLAGAPWPKFQHDLANTGYQGGAWAY